MKTIFITSLTPFVTRNILLTDAFGKLRQMNDLRVVVFCPDFKRSYFVNNFSGRNVVIEGLRSQVFSRQDYIFKYLGGSLLNSRTRYMHQRRELLRDRNYVRFLISRFLSVLGRYIWVKRFVRFLDTATIDPRKYAAYFDKYKPDLVFCPDVFHDDDVHCLAEAKARSVRAVGMVRSWDNVTNKGLFRVQPDYLLVNNEIIRNEVIKLEDMDPGRVIVMGMPQFDAFLSGQRASREEFFKRINLDPAKKLVMFSPHGIRFHDTDWHIMQILKEAIDGGEFSTAVQVLVRFPPIDEVPLGNFVPDENFFIDRPARMFQGGLHRDQELDEKAVGHLMDSLYYSDVVVTYNSSIIIDAAVFDKPAIGVAFDGWEKKPDVFQSVARFMEYDHTKHILNTGGLHVVRSRQELVDAIEKYIKDPLYNLRNRRRIIETQCWKLDSRSGERIADFICDRVYRT